MYNFPSNYTLLEVPDILTVPLADAKIQLNIFMDTSEDDYITSLLYVAQERCEDYSHVYLRDAVFSANYRSYTSSGFVIPFVSTSVASINTVTYVDTTGQTILIAPTNYYLDTSSKYPTIRFYPSFTAPSVGNNYVENPFTILFTINYANGVIGDTKRFRQAVLLTLADLYTQRTDSTMENLNTIPNGAMRLLSKYVPPLMGV